jgi:hypothetical protein
MRAQQVTKTIRIVGFKFAKCENIQNNETFQENNEGHFCNNFGMLGYYKKG